LVTAAKDGRTAPANIDLLRLTATMTKHGRLGCALDNATGEKGIDDER
jgi:hypothetical protein